MACMEVATVGLPTLSPGCHPALCPPIHDFPPNYSSQRRAESRKWHVVRAVCEDCSVELSARDLGPKLESCWTIKGDEMLFKILVRLILRP